MGLFQALLIYLLLLRIKRKISTDGSLSRIGLELCGEHAFLIFFPLDLKFEFDQARSDSCKGAYSMINGGLQLE